MVPSALAVLFICSVPETVDLTVATVPGGDAPAVLGAEELVVEGAGGARVAPLLVLALVAVEVTVALLHSGQALARTALELIEGTRDISCKMDQEGESESI